MNQSTDTNKTILNRGTFRFLVPVAAAILLGGMAGAGVMMLYAPRSGKETRKKIKEGSSDLRNKAFSGVRRAVKNTASRSRKLTKNTKSKVNDLQEQGRERIADQLGKVASGVKAAQKAVQP